MIKIIEKELTSSCQKKTASTLNQARFKNPARSIYERFSFSIKIIIYNHHYYLFYYFYLLTISLK